MNSLSPLLKKHQALFEIKEVITPHQAEKIADLYIPYYKRMSLTKEAFLEKWAHAKAHRGYYMLAAYEINKDQPLGIIDFALVPSIFWAPFLARIDSFHIQEISGEEEVRDLLFFSALEIMNQNKVSKVIAVSCSKYEQEIRLLTSKLQIEDNLTKTFFTLADPTAICN